MSSSSWINRNLWTLRRFGLTPSSLFRRLGNKLEPRILCVSIPKAGTHLLERALCLHPRLYRKLLPTINDVNIRRWHGLAPLLAGLKPGQIICSHLTYSKEYETVLKDFGIRCIFLIRDPRDIVVSQAFYIAKNEQHRLHEVFAPQPDLKSRIKLAIQGYEPGRLPSIAQRLKDYSGWLDSGAIVIRFEDLIGPHGKGSESQQVDTLRSIYNYLGLNVDYQWIESLAGKLFSDSSPTFRQGASGQWEKLFDGEINLLFQSKTAKWMKLYGYS